MKHLVLLLAFIGFFAADALSQQLPLYSLYNQNRYVYNPAFTGAGEQGNVYAIYRRQWDDIEGAPETRALSFDMPIAKNKAGIGGYFYNDITDIFRRYGGYLSYAYHIKFSDSSSHRLSIGLAAGAQDMRIDFDRVFVIDPTDDAIANNAENATAFDGTAGINYSFKGFNFGISVPHLFSTRLRYLNDDEESFFRLQRHYLASTRYTFDIAERFYFTPHVMFRTADLGFDNFQIDGGLTIAYKNWFWIDATYRYDYAVTIGGGFKVHNKVSVGYAYDLPINELKDFAGNTHEIMLGFHFNKGKRGGTIDEEQLEELEKKFAMQDSAIAELEVRVDTVEQVADTISTAIESGAIDALMNGEVTGSGGDGSGGGSGSSTLTQEEVDSLNRKIDELLEKLKGLEQQVDENSQIYREMSEERTRIVDEKDLEFKKGVEYGDFFMVVGSFRIEKNSYSYQEQLSAEGYDAGVVYDKKRKWYYVFLTQPASYEQGLQELYRLREEDPQFRDAWIHILSENFR